MTRTIGLAALATAVGLAQTELPVQAPKAVAPAASTPEAPGPGEPRTIPQLLAAIAANPNDVGAHFDLAVENSSAGEDAKAIPEYRKTLELMPDLYEAHLNFGQVLLRAKQPEEAIEHLRRAHQQKPAEFRGAYFLGEALFDLGQNEDALAAFNEAAAIDQNAMAPELGRARALARLQRLAEAEPHYRQAVALGADPNFLLELAQMREQAGELEEAIALYAEFPKNPAAVERVGALRLKQGKDQEAVAALESVVQSSPTDANRFALAQAYVRLNALEKAEPLAGKLADEAPQNFDLRMFYGRILRDRKKYAEAAREFQNATRIKAEAPEGWSELAGMLVLTEQFQPALAAFQKVEELGAANAGVYFFRATTHDRLNQKKEAVEYYQRFLDVSQTNPDQEFQARQRIRVIEGELGRR